MAYKLAVLFHEPETEGKDLSRPELGNPGVGGTAYCFALLLQALQAKGNGEIYVYSVQDVKLPVENFIRVESALEGLRAAEKNAHRTVLLRNHQEDQVYALLECLDLRYIFWMHNRLTYTEIQLFRNTKQVKRVVAVGREMYDFYVDDLICDKMAYVPNPFIPPSEQYIRGPVKEKRVTYVGSLIPDKNFHILAAYWKAVLQAVPDATLHIIGNGEMKDRLLQKAKDTGAEVIDHKELYDPSAKQMVFDQCHYGLNIMKPSVVVGLTMKSLDYLCAGLPLINTIGGDTQALCRQYDIGWNLTDENCAETVKAICRESLDEWQKKRNQAQEVYQMYFTEASFFATLDKAGVCDA